MLNARPIVVNDKMEVLGGNMRVRAAISLGIKELPILAKEWDATELQSWGLGVWNPEEEVKEEQQESHKEEQIKCELCGK